MNNLGAEEDRVAGIAEFEVKLGRLVAICDRPTLTPQELEERDALIKYLGEQDFDKKEISALIGGKLAEDTIRKKVASVVVSDSPIKARITSLVVEMILNHIHINDVPKATEIMKVLGSRNVGLDDVASLIEECKRGNQDLKSVIDSFTVLKQSGLPIQQLAEGLAYKKELEDMGLHNSDLKKISEIASKNGRQPGKVLDSIFAHGDLEAINVERDTARQEHEKATQKVKKAKAELMKLQTNAEHLQPVIAMCQELLHKYGYTTGAIQSIVHIAMKYGAPFVMLNALEEYGNIEALKKDSLKLKYENIGLAADIAEKQKSIAALEGQLMSIESAVKGLVKTVREEIRLAYKDLLGRPTGPRTDSQVGFPG